MGSSTECKMKECCYNCKLCCKLEKWDYGKIGEGKWKSTYDGFACMLFAPEGVVIHMTGNNIHNDFCECFTERKTENPWERTENERV